jgi:apolipoprotein N-acyltransferase
VLSGQADPQPAGRQDPDVLPGLRLSSRTRRLLAGFAAAILSAALLALSNPPADLGPLALVALTPLLWALRRSGPGRGALLGGVFGGAYYGTILAWLLPFGVVAWSPVVLAETMYVAAFGLLLPLVASRSRPWWWWAVAAAALWTALDWVRSTFPVGGFTWGALGYTQHGRSSLLPLASVLGVWGITFGVLLVNALLVVAAERLWAVRRTGDRRTVARAVAPALVAVVVMIAPSAIPTWSASGPPLDVAVVQGNVPLRTGEDVLFGFQTAQVTGHHVRLHRLLADDPPDVAVWPENSVDLDANPDPAELAAVSEAIREVGAPTLVGAVTRASDGTVHNEVLQFDPSGSVVASYAKIHLVPFGEYVPFRSLFGWVDQLRAVPRDLTPGTAIALFDVDGVKVGTPICFENTFPDLFRRFVKAGAGVVVVTTNDSAYARSPASREHVIMSQIRAVETGRWVVQAALSGISAVVAPDGQVVKETPLFRQRLLRYSVPTSDRLTPYTRFGDVFPWACGALVLFAAGFEVVARRRRRAVSPPPTDPGQVEASPDDAAVPSPAPIAGGAAPRVLVILPTYNEAATIRSVLDGVLAAGPNVSALVVDDGSPDGTAKLVADVAAGEPRVRLLRRDRKLGLASAYLTGFRLGIDDAYDVLVEMDADLSHRPEDLPSVIGGTDRFDLSIGSRYVPGGAVSNWSRARLALSKGGNAYARAVLGIPVRDVTSGFRAYRREALETLLEDPVASDGYGFQVELAYRAWRSGMAVSEVPITFREREHGRSKLSRRIVLEALWQVTRWGVRDRLRRRAPAVRATG